MKLSERAMLASLNVKRWDATRTDKKVTDEVARTHKVDAVRAGHYRKHVINPKAVTYMAVVAASSALRTAHYKWTLPWGQDGSRILTTMNFELYSAEMRKLRAEFDKAVAAFIKDLPNLQAQARVELNGMFNERDYPSNVKAKFGVDVVIMPIPDDKDFRAALTDDVVEDIRKNIREELGRVTETAMRDPYERLYTHINRMVERLSDKKAVFRDTLVTGLAELCSILPGLNLTNDKRLESLRKQAEAMITDLDPQDLRETPSVRRSVAKQAREIQDVMAGFMGAPTTNDEEEAA